MCLTSLQVAGGRSWRPEDEERTSSSGRDTELRGTSQGPEQRKKRGRVDPVQVRVCPHQPNKTNFQPQWPHPAGTFAHLYFAEHAEPPKLPGREQRSLVKT